MAVKTVTGKLTGPSNAAIGGVLVTAQLSASAVIAATQEIAPLAVTTQTATDGTWSLSLQANGDLTPGSTYYTVSVGPNWTATAIVPQTAGPFLIENIMAVAPNAWLGGTAATINPAGDIAARSFTALANGPYGAFLPGAPTVPTPAGVTAGKVWDWGGSVFNVMAAGAKGDGVTDDGTALAALCTKIGTGGSGVIPPGVFITNQALATGNASAGTAIPWGAALLGIGAVSGKEGVSPAANAGAIIQAGSSFPNGSPLLTIGQNHATKVWVGFWLKGLSFECLNGGVRADGVIIYNTDQAIVEDVFINNAATNGLIASCPLQAAGVDKLSFNRVKVATIQGTALDTAGIVMGANCYYSQISDCSAISCAGDGIALVNSVQSRITASVVDNPGQRGFLIDGGHDALITDSVIFTGTGLACLQINGSNKCRVIGNYFANANKNNNQTNGNAACIYNNSSRGCIVADNVLEKVTATYSFFEAGVNSAEFNTYQDNFCYGFSGTAHVVMSAGGTPVLRHNQNYNPVGANTPLAVPAIATTLVTNTTGVDCRVYLKTSGTNNVPQVNMDGVNTGLVIPISSSAFVGIVPAGGTIQLPGATLTGTTWTWSGL